jgi:hypothetical protein
MGRHPLSDEGGQAAPRAPTIAYETGWSIVCWNIPSDSFLSLRSLRIDYWSMSRSLKVFLFLIWGLLLIPLIGASTEKWLEENVFFGPNAVATTVFDHLVAVRQLRWFNLALVFMTGLVIGVLLESLSRASGERKAFELRSLGYRLRSLSENIKSRIAASGWPDNSRDLKPAIMSAFNSARNFGLWVPSERVYELPDPSFLCEYFKCVGRLLEEGHLDEARAEALSWKPFLDRAKLP